MKRIFYLALAAVLILSAFVTVHPTQAQSQGKFRLIHASATAPEVDVYVNGERVFNFLAFKSYSNFIKANAGTYEIALREAGAAESTDPVFTKEFKLAADQTLTIVAQGEPGNDFDMFVYETEDVAPSGKALLHLIHAIPTAVGIDLTAKDQVVTKNVEYGTIRSLPAAEGLYDLKIVPTGESEPVVLNLSGSAIVKDVVYTYVITGTVEEPTSMRIGDGQMYLGSVNVAAGTPPIDIYLNDELVFEGIAFKKFSDLQIRDSGRYRVAIRKNGTAADSDPIFQTNIALPGGVAANLIVMGNPDSTSGDDQMRINAYWGAPIVSEGRSSVNVIHAAPSFAPVVILESDKAITTSIAYQDIGSASGPAKTYQIKVADNGNNSLVRINLPDYELKAGKLHFVIFTQDESGKPDVLRFFASPFVSLRDGVN